MINEFSYPDAMVGALRWMVRLDGSKYDKQPVSVHEEQPPGYDAAEAWARTRWGNPCQWVDLPTAVEYAASNPDVTHLCFVLKDPGEGLKKRFICFDFDNCIDEKGNLDPVVADFIAETNSFTELSKNGRGLHVFAQYVGKPFKNKKATFGNCTVDIITNGQVVTTGKVYRKLYGWAEINNWELQERFDMRTRVVEEHLARDCWSEDIHGDVAALADDMRDWPECIEGYGGDKEFFKAACHLARHGITGDKAVELLGLVYCDPAFSPAEVRHKVESAFAHVVAEGEFGLYREGRRSAASEFDPVEPIEEPVELGDQDPGPRLTPGFEGLNIDEHFDAFNLGNMPAFIIRDLMFESGALIIGGQNKTFKTTVGLDLLLSIATLKPFLNAFPIECETKSIAVFSSETREFLITQYLTSILAAKGLRVGDLHKPFTINSRVPAFSMDKDGRMRKNRNFERYLKDHKPEVVFFDPLYRMFAGVNQADISSMGQALEYVEQTCIDHGAMPIFCHHSRKPNTMAGGDFPIMTLNDLSGAGGGAFCRQWLLLSHTRQYCNGSGRLHACVGASGADEHQWIINVETYDDNRQRCWKTNATKMQLGEEILHVIFQSGGSTVSKLSKALKRSEAEIKIELDRLDSADKVNLVNNTVQLVSDLKGELDV